MSISIVPQRRRWFFIVAACSICLLTGCGLLPPSRGPLARRLDDRLSPDVAQQVDRDPFPSASQVGL